MNRAFLFLFFPVVLLIGCIKKEKGENQNLDPNNQKKYDLMTNKEGSWWLYGGSDSSVSRRVATGRDSTMKGLFFSYYIRTDTTTGYITHEFFGKNSDRYINLIDLDGTQTRFITVVFFKDGAAPGSSWLNIDQLDYSGIPFDIRVESKLEDTGGIMVMNGKTYNSVNRIHNDLYGRTNLGGLTDWVPAGTLDIWFVKGIGIIKQDMDINVLSGYFTKVYRDSLLDYYFVPE